MMGADWWQQQELLEREMWLADEAGRAEYDSWLKTLEPQKELDHAMEG